MSWYDLDNEALKTANTVWPVMKIPRSAHASTGSSLSHPPKSPHTYPYLIPLPSQTESALCYSSTSLYLLHQNARNTRTTVIYCLTQRRRLSICQRIGIHTPIQQTLNGTYTAVSCGNVNGLMTEFVHESMGRPRSRTRAMSGTLLHAVAE